MRIWFRLINIVTVVSPIVEEYLCPVAFTMVVGITVASVNVVLIDSSWIPWSSTCDYLIIMIGSHTLNYICVVVIRNCLSSLRYIELF